VKRAHHDLKVWQEAMELVKMVTEPLLVQIDKLFGLLGGLINSLRKRTNP
jgi:hypothetical protein